MWPSLRKASAMGSSEVHNWPFAKLFRATHYSTGRDAALETTAHINRLLKCQPYSKGVVRVSSSLGLGCRGHWGSPGDPARQPGPVPPQPGAEQLGAATAPGIGHLPGDGYGPRQGHDIRPCVGLAWQGQWPSTWLWDGGNCSPDRPRGGPQLKVAPLGQGWP